MAQLAERIVADLRESGLYLDEAGDDWFAVHGESHHGAPEAFLHLSDNDIERYLDGMGPENVDGVFGPDVSLDDARYRLTLAHLEEHLLSYHGGIRYVVVDGGEIRTFDTDSLPTLPPGNYEWRA
jgi:hypothetical protein